MLPRTIDDVIAGLERPNLKSLPAPRYLYNDSTKNIVCGVASMKDHMTDEGWQITHGLSLNGYLHTGYGLDEPLTDMRKIVQKHRPIGTLVLQDKREWRFDSRSFRDPRAHFDCVECLSMANDIFKLTILKDAQQSPVWHAEAAQEMGCHAWICYYHPRIVHHLAPYIRPEHLIRTYHTLDPEVVPEFNAERTERCLLSGAVSGAYPLRQRLVAIRHAPWTIMKHPGYHRMGSDTPNYLRELSKYKIAICTSSRYGYSLRKIIEATAAGCIVLTDLPIDDVLPGIDGNLVRIHPETPEDEIVQLVLTLAEGWNAGRQHYYSEQAAIVYDYRLVTSTLAFKISRLKERYNG